MADPARQIPEVKDHTLRWAREDWDRILQAADMLNEREHLDLGPSDIIRSGTRRYLDDLFSQLPAKAS